MRVPEVSFQQRRVQLLETCVAEEMKGLFMGDFCLPVSHRDRLREAHLISSSNPGSQCHVTCPDEGTEAEVCPCHDMCPNEGAEGLGDSLKGVSAWPVHQTNSAFRPVSSHEKLAHGGGREMEGQKQGTHFSTADLDSHPPGGAAPPCFWLPRLKAVGFSHPQPGRRTASPENRGLRKGQPTNRTTEHGRTNPCPGEWRGALQD